MRARLRMPHTLPLLMGMMAAALIATWVVPQGSFVLEPGPSGRPMVVPGTFSLTATRTLLTPWDLFRALPRAFASAQDIIFFLLIIGGVISLIRATGTIDALLGRLLERFGSRPGLLVFAVILTLALASSAMGASGEYIPFVLILVALCRAMGFDALTAVGMIVAGYGIGYGMAAFNPYTVVTAQGIAGVPTYSGWLLKMTLLPVFVLIGVHHVRSHALRMRTQERGVDGATGAAPPPPAAGNGYPAMSARHLLVVVGFAGALGVSIWGIATRGWYLTELGAAFLALGIVATLIGRIAPSQAAGHFISGARELTETALLVGVARGIALVMEDGGILHTLVHALSVPLQSLGPEVAAVGMLGLQSTLNFFIPSGSGQAFVTMPIMAPLGDLVGVSRQVSVLAFQFGDGFTNMLVPTNPVLMGILGMGGIAFDRWFRFCLPLLLKLLAAAAAVLVLAVRLGWG
jgi:uncharacterized ion transporter superfamily protein YfcC